jgi:glutathione S-transferase
MSITLYELQPTRSARARWTLLELGVPFESIAGREVFEMPELAQIHPLSKLPALRDGGRPLFESAAICNWLADSHPEAGLVARSGTWARALHDQWVAFTLSEIEAFLWHTARNMFILPEDERLPAVFPQNAAAAKRGLAVLDAHLTDRAWLVDDRFSLTDIFTGYAACWGVWQGMSEDLPHLTAYVERLQARPLCPYHQDVPAAVSA